MPWLKNRTIEPQKLKALRLALYRKLRKEAFNNYFECAHCQGHNALEVHHLAYDPDHFDDPAWYTILCRKCHAQQHKKLHPHG